MEVQASERCLRAPHDAYWLRLWSDGGMCGMAAVWMTARTDNSAKLNRQNRQVCCECTLRRHARVFVCVCIWFCIAVCVSVCVHEWCVSCRVEELSTMNERAADLWMKRRCSQSVMNERSTIAERRECRTVGRVETLYYTIGNLDSALRKP